MATAFDPARPAEADTLLALMQAFYAEEGLSYDAERAEASLGELLARPALGRAWLVRDHGEVVGYLAVTFGFSLEFGGRFGLLDEIYLRPDARGRGLGAAILDHVAAFALAQDLSAVRLEAERHNTRALGLYDRAGYFLHERELLTLYLR